MSATDLLRRALVRLACLATAVTCLGGCLIFDGLVILLDLDRREARITIQRIASNGRDDWDELVDAPAQVETDFAELITKYVGGDQLDHGGADWGLPRWRLIDKQLVPRAGAPDILDGELRVGFERLADLRLWSWDRAHPHAWCPPAGMRVVRTNATARTARGCLVWRTSTRSLRVELAPATAPPSRFDLGAHHARWRARQTTP